MGFKLDYARKKSTSYLERFPSGKVLFPEMSVRTLKTDVFLSSIMSNILRRQFGYFPEK